MKNQMFNRVLLFVVVICSLLWIIACAVNPVTGKREFMLMTEAEEIQLGGQSDGQIIQQYGLYDDPQISQFVTDLGTRMVKISHRSHLEFYFRVLDTPVINAFAVPGGYIYITRGILAYLNSEAEFAGVMGHEIGHITARHSAKQYSRQKLTQLGLGIGTAVSSTFAQFSGVAQTGLGLIFLKFGRNAERESDRLGVEYSTKIGYDAREMANFFQVLDRMQPPGNRGAIPSWFSTHPNPGDRVKDIGGLAQEWRKQVDTGQLHVNRNSFLKKTNGLIYGEDPRHGYEEGNMFYHPELKFQFPIPDGWQLVNTPTQVQIVASDEKAAVLFTLTSGATISGAAAAFNKESGAKSLSSNNIKVNGLDAKMIISDISGQQGNLRVISFFIKYGNNIFIFHGFSDQGSFSSNRPSLELPMKNFRRLTDKRKINVKPDRIRLKTVTRTLTVRDALIALKVADKKLEETALINGMKLTEMVKPNTLLKIIAK